MKKLLPIIIILPAIFLIGFGLYTLYLSTVSNPVTSLQDSNPSAQISNTPEIESKPEVSVVEEVQAEYPNIKVCYKNDCKRVSSSIVKWIVEDEDKKSTRASGHFDSHIMPHFYDKYFRKITTQNSKGMFNHYINNTLPNMTEAKINYLKTVDSIVEGDPEITVKVVEIDSPGTDGKYADRYIEVDNSKQRLYAWKDGRVRKVIELSGPKYGYQVYGVFPIVDKGVQPIAPGGLYMPYWMAFHYAPGQESWYGLHGLIWWYEGNSSKVYEPLSNIGVRRSAGCIRMLVEDAKYLYDIYQRGDPVLIHE